MSDRLSDGACFPALPAYILPAFQTCPLCTTLPLRILILHSLKILLVILILHLRDLRSTTLNPVLRGAAAASDQLTTLRIVLPRLFDNRLAAVLVGGVCDGVALGVG